jgi:hypothetical protein
MLLVYGIFIGWISLYLFLILYKLLKEKRGIKREQYGNIPFTARLRNIIRHIIFEYNIKRKNNDFLYNIDLDGKRVMQLMHRAHFPELCRSESDLAFGLALYIPVKGWNEERIKKLDNIINEETEIKHTGKTGELEYYIIELGKRARFGGYLLSRIVKEVFEAEESRFSFELFSEGNLPYHLN